jgi:hypothetical protein
MSFPPACQPALQKLFSCIVFIFLLLPAFSQKRMVAIGSSTTAGLVTSPDSSWVRRFSFYYKNQLGVLDTAFNLGVSGTTVYRGMPTSYTPPAGRPVPDPVRNVTRAVSLFSNLPTPADGVTIVNFPSNGYDTYSIAEIMTALQIIYDSATRNGNKCYITTTQPRSDGNFGTSAVKRKMAVLKDSIIKRFGVAHTINFYDGMYNPADSSILPIYSAGDNVHFNNAGHRELFERVRAKNIFDLPLVQYRSNVSPTGLWSDPASWQIFNGSSWVAATMPPSSGSGAITILNGDSIRINSYTELDQVVIESGGVLTMFNVSGSPPAKLTVALNDGAGDDVIVNSNGRLYISSNAILSGTGTILNNSGGLFTIRNRGVLETNATNEGTMWVNSTGIVRNRTLTNNNSFVLADFTLNLINASFINNDSVSIIGTGTTFIVDSTLTGGIFNNTSTGVVFRQSTTGATNFNPSVSLINNGSIKGFGEYVLNNTAASSTGSVAPGTSPGTLTVNPAFISSHDPIINIEISSTGAVQGTNYDRLIISNVAPTAINITGATLNVTDNASDPIGTVYTIITPASGTITGTFATINLSPTLSGPNYNNGNFITVTKASSLPLKWGSFIAVPKNKQVLLNWSTLEESNTSHFEVEHSSDGVSFYNIGEVVAQGESSVTAHYSFTHSNPNINGKNYYRLKQVDRDYKFAYSNTLTVRFRNAKAAFVEIMPNPVRDFMNIEVHEPDITIVLTDLNGKEVRKLALVKGRHQVSLTGLSSGTYQLSVYQKQQRVEGQRIVKL